MFINIDMPSFDEAVFDEEGLKFDREMNKKLRGVSRTESLEIVLRENNVQMNQTKKDEILKKKNDLYVELLHEKLNPSCISEETRGTLKTLKDALSEVLLRMPV